MCGTGCVIGMMAVGLIVTNKIQNRKAASVWRPTDEQLAV